MAATTMTLDELARGFQTLQEAMQRIQRLVLNVPRLHRKDLMRRYGISEDTLDRWIKRGLIPAPIRLGGQALWRLEDVEAAESGGRLPRPVSG